MSIAVGLIVNPVAGIGGRVALKGSDGRAIQQEARRRGAAAWTHSRCRRALEAAAGVLHDIRWLAWGGAMGGDLLASLDVPCRTLGIPSAPSTADDTRSAATAFAAAGADLILFCGGDGTARDVLAAIGDRLPALGIPGGVKMHSGVFATTPEAAAAILCRLVEGGLVRAARAEVRDLDEQALRAGEIRPHLYGELRVPELGGFLQHTKERGRESEPLAMVDIVADIVERLQADAGVAWVLGPGSTVAAIKEALGMQAAMLGVDVWQRGRQTGHDVDAQWLEARVEAPAGLVISFGRGQGILLGRGNQQLSPAFIRRVDPDRLVVVATRSKLRSLEGRPLLVDTDDAALDRQLCGLVEVTSGYEDRLWYRVDRDA